MRPIFPLKFYKVCYQISDLIVSKAAKTVLPFQSNFLVNDRIWKKARPKGRLRVNDLYFVDDVDWDCYN